jgi:hypothetical protein
VTSNSTTERSMTTVSESSARHTPGCNAIRKTLTYRDGLATNLKDASSRRSGRGLAFAPIEIAKPFRLDL